MDKLISTDLGHGITCIDSQHVRTGLASCYLIEQNGHAAFIDVGTNHTTPLLLELLKKKNIPLEKVDYVIPTHVHLDHAGGAGSLMQQLPKAKLIIHPRGARHMIDPSRLQAGATAVYGEEEFSKQYGSLVAIDEQRVQQANDADSIDFQGRSLEFIHTPGHAKHHFCIVDKTSNGVFTGDTFGVVYPELTANEQPFIFPPTTPVDFDPGDWHASIDKIMATGCDRVYLAHFSMIQQLAPLADTLRQRISLFAELCQKHPNNAALHQVISDYCIDQVSANGSLLSKQEITEVLSLDLGILVQGLLVWLEKNQ
ncbi:MAG: MBL fold metallo-hydrolase [Cycloclasticus sp.]